MMERTGTLVLISIFLVSTAAGASFGSFSSGTEKTVNGRTATFTIEVLNLGSSPLHIELEAYQVDSDVTVRFNAPGSGFNSFTLPPSEVTSDPSSDASWFLLKNGKYVQTSEIKVKAFLDRARPDNVAHFKVRVKASTATPDSGYSGSQTNPTQSVVQVRSYSYTVRTSAARTSVAESETQNRTGALERAADFGAGLVQNFNDGFDGVFSGFSGGSATGSATHKPDIRVKDPGREQQGSDTGQQVSPEPRTSDSSEKQNNNVTGGFFSSVNPVTPALLLGALASMLYLLKVV
ncbi:MAG: hypothetical protein ABEJ75_01875 [Candidatus Nanohaloarchaea archaeon]